MKLTTKKQPRKCAGSSTPPEDQKVSPSTILESGASSAASADELSVASNQEQLRAVEQVGRRLRAAREINGWDVTEAARRLGYKNAGSLSRLETGKHVLSIPLYMLARAAQVYGVTTDYLLGLTDDLSLAPTMRLRRDAALWLADYMERQRHADVTAYLMLQEQVELVTTGTKEVILAVEELTTSLAGMRSANAVVFDNMRGGSRVLSMAARAERVSVSTAARLNRFRGMLQASGIKVPKPVNPNQLPLELPEGV